MWGVCLFFSLFFSICITIVNKEFAEIKHLLLSSCLHVMIGCLGSVLLGIFLRECVCVCLANVSVSCEGACAAGCFSPETLSFVVLPV